MLKVGTARRRFCPPSDRYGSLAYRLDIIPVGIDQERGVVGGAVVLARARAAIVAAAGLDALGVEFLHRVMVFRAEGDMGAIRLLALVQMQPERGRALRAEAGAAVVARAQH